MQPKQEIEITLPDKSVRKGTSWETSPMAVAKAISQGLADRTVIAKVDGAVWDLERPLEASCTLELLDFEHPEGKRVFWHSSAHVLGEAAERHYGCHLCIGPPTDEGFFYEMAIEDRPVTTADYPSLEKISELAIKEKQKFERLVVSKEVLLEMFGVRAFTSNPIVFLTVHISTTSTRSSSSSRRSPTAHPLRCIVAGPWSICALVRTSHTQARSNRSWSPRSFLVFLYLMSHRWN